VNDFVCSPSSKAQTPNTTHMPPRAEKIRKQYKNSEYPHVVLRFEDGHEIIVPKGAAKSFDAYVGERIKILAIYDPTANEREKIDTLRAEQFEDATA
jgi:hypothetical protein